MLNKGTILELNIERNKQLVLVISRDLWNQQGVPYILQLVPEDIATSKLAPVVFQDKKLYADFTHLYSLNTLHYKNYEIVGKVSNREIYKITKMIQQIFAFNMV